MLTEKIEINCNDLDIKINRNNLIVKGLSSNKEDQIFFNIRYKNKPKNFILSTQINSNMISGVNEIKFYFRFINKLNYCCFILKGGQYIKFQIIGNGKPQIETSYIKITDENFFCDKFFFILSVFEDTTTVLMNNEIILNMEQTPEVEGELGIQFNNDEKKEKFNLTMESLIISEDILNFEPIIEIPKKPDPYFMQANDFYEQERYDLALLYYKKGLLFGKGDDKIYNRVGNLLFLVEDYENALKYYMDAINEDPGKIEYKINLGRTYVNLKRDEEAIPLLEQAIDNGIKDPDMLVDYATIWMRKKSYNRAIVYLERAEKIDPDNFTALYKLGKCLIENDKIDQGKEKLLKAAKLIEKKDPSMAAIILKYSIEKKADKESLKLLSNLLLEKEEYRTIYEVIKNSQWEIDIDSDLLEFLLKSEIKIGLKDLAISEFKKIPEEKMNNNLRYLKAKTLIEVDKLEDAEKELDYLFKNYKNEKNELNINKLILLKLKIFNKLNKFNEALEIYEKSNKDLPFFDKIIIEMGKIYVNNKRYNEAIEFFNYLQDKNDFEIISNLGISYLFIENFNLAKDYLLKAYSIKKTPEIAFYLATSLFYTYYYNDALNIIQENIDNLPKNGSVENLLGNIYLALNDIPLAQKYYYKSLELDPENEEYGLNLAESFYRLKDYENAYYITKQIVKKDKFDRAKVLHLKIKQHLFITISCSGCSVEWSFPKNISDATISKESLAKLPEGAPAGFCPKCKKNYCNICAQGIPDKDAKCPNCNSILQYNSPSLRIIADRMLRGEND